MNRMKYEDAELEIILLASNDVITTSDEIPLPPIGGDDDE